MYEIYFSTGDCYAAFMIKTIPVRFTQHVGGQPDATGVLGRPQ